jgi:hypothetical protein
MPADIIAGGASRASGASGSGGGEGGRPARDEMHAAPPFLTWGAIYGIVLGALALQIAIYAALTAIYR